LCSSLLINNVTFFDPIQVSDTYDTRKEERKQLFRGVCQLYSTAELQVSKMIAKLQDELYRLEGIVHQVMTSLLLCNEQGQETAYRCSQGGQVREQM
jgi:hypothetical protein